MKINHLLAKAALVAAFFWPAFCQAVDFEAGIGITRSKTEADGNWFQKGFPNTLDLAGKAWMVGVTGKATESVRWHLDYTDLGRYSSDAMAVTNDANYNAKTRGCNGPCGPLARYVGAGRLRTLSATLEYRRGDLGVEAGVDAFRPLWREIVTGWQADWGAPVQRFDITQPTRVQLGIVAGFAVYRGPWSVRLRYHYDRCRDDQGSCLWQGVGAATLNYSF